MSGYPSFTDYRTAVSSSFDKFVLDQNLKGGQAKENNRGKLLFYTGGFSIVFPIEVPHTYKTFALRCWKRKVKEAEERYQKIEAFLSSHNLSYFVDCRYVPNGILVRGQPYPTTRMEWVKGQTLCKFIKANLGTPTIFKTIADKFAIMVKDLHDHQIAHGDLQDGNILLLQNGTNIEIKLIDYDSIYVPTLRGKLDRIVGLPEYQHPIRMAGRAAFNEKIDYFSELAIYLSFRSLAEKPTLWNQLERERTEKGLLFSADDFKDPNQSKVFQELAKMSPEIKHLASTLKDFCAEQSINNLKPLENVIQPSPTRPAPSPSRSKSKVPQTALDYYNQGISYLSADHPNYAVQQFKEAIKLKPDYKEAYYYCGFAYFKLKQLTPAKSVLEAVLKIDSNYKTAQGLLQDVNREIQWNLRFQKRHYDTALNFYNQGDLQKAKDEIEKALKINPNYKSARDLLQKTYNRLSYQSTSRPKRHYDTALNFYNQGDLQKAKDEIEKALNIDRNYRDARNLLASIQAEYSRLAETYMNKGQNDKALAAYEEVIKIGEQLG